MTNDNIVGVGGPIETIAESFQGKCISVAMSSVFGVGGSAFRTMNDRKLLVDTIPFPAYKRKVFQEFGSFDEELLCNEDDEYNYRIRKHGGQLLLVPSIRSRYHSRESLSKLWKQLYRYGYWKVPILQKHPYQMRLRQFVPPVFVGSLFLSILLSLFWFPALYLFTGILGVYFVANLSASVWTAHCKGWRYFPLLPIAYSIMHVAYGTGFNIGLFRHINRWGNMEN